MTIDQINEAASKFASRTEFGEVIFPDDYWNQFVAALAPPAISASKEAAPAGAFKIVPCEPTQRMGNAGVLAGAKSTFAADMIYRAMLEAAPALSTDAREDGLDAERYWWLREHGAELFYALADLEGDALDAAVDAGRKEQRHDRCANP